MSAPERPPEGWRDLKRYQVYLDALAMEKAAEEPETVCVTEDHYRKGRHPIPYRMGYCHYHKRPNEHYHRTLAELERCEA